MPRVDKSSFDQKPSAHPLFHKLSQCLAILAFTFAFALMPGCSGGGGSQPLPAPPSPPSPPPEKIDEIDLIYATGVTEKGEGEIDLKLDIYQPEGICDANLPYVMLIHGGAYVGGSKTNASLVAIARDLNDMGIPAISMNYRLVGDEPVPGLAYKAIEDAFIAAVGDEITEEQRALFPTIASAMEDTVKALEWVGLNGAERCIDGNNFVILGVSAGAYISLFVTYSLDDFSIFAPRPKAVIDFFGALHKEDSMSVSDPPLMIIHGDQDTVVAYELGQIVAERANENAIPYSFYTIIGGGHGLTALGLYRTLIDDKTLNEVMLDFIDAHLNNSMPVYEVRSIPRL